jgi:hypothetical protein
MQAQKQHHGSLPVYRNKITRKTFALVMEAGGTVELQDAQGFSTYTTSAKLADPEIWEKQP